MNRMMGIFSLVWGSFLLFAGCRETTSTTPHRPPLAPGANAVAVHDRMPPDCTPQGRITGRAASSESGEAVWRYALNDLRNQAAARQVQSVFMERYNHRTEGNLLVIEITGVLLNCPAPNNGPAPAGSDDTLTPPPAGDGDALTPPPPPEEGEVNAPPVP